ncbi:MAG: hypothetical protein M3475_05185, partial [Actinomycetota bacterium]|nr:hypothetical protein [Actinomycetota bacterium]
MSLSIVPGGLSGGWEQLRLDIVGGTSRRAIRARRECGYSLTTLIVILPLVLALLSAPVAALAGMLHPRLAALTGAALAALAAVAVLWGWSMGGG